MEQDKNKKFLYTTLALFFMITLCVPFGIFYLQHLNEAKQQIKEKEKKAKIEKEKNRLFKKTHTYTATLYRSSDNAASWALVFDAVTSRGYRLTPFVSSVLPTQDGFYVATDLQDGGIGLHRLSTQGAMIWFKKLYGDMNYNDTVMLQKESRLYISGGYPPHRITLDTKTNQIIDFSSEGFRQILAYSNGYLGLNEETLRYFDYNNNELKRIDFSSLIAKLPKKLNLSDEFRAREMVRLKDNSVVVVANIKDEDNNFYPWILKLDSSLKLQYQKLLLDYKGYSIHHIIETSDHKLIVSGRGKNKFIVSALDNNAHPLWEKSYTTKNGFGITMGLIELPNTHILIGVRTSKTFYLIYIDRHGTIVQEKRFQYDNQPSDFYIKRMILHKRALFFSGSVTPPSGLNTKEGIIIKTDINGEINTPLISSIMTNNIKSIDDER